MAKKILVVDDLEQNRMLLKDALRYFGYEVVEADNGEEGVKMARAELPDLILMDMNMPVMDGYTALQVLRSDPLTRGLKVAAVTSFSAGNENERGFAAGADGYIPKPIDIRELPAMVERIIAGEGKPAGGQGLDANRPRSRAEGPRPVPAGDRLGEKMMEATKPRILCVDDEPFNLDLLEALLVPRNYEVIRATGGRDALAQVASQKVDLVLLDVMMPEIDGFEVCRRIKENEQHRSIPVVMITALTAKEDRVAGIEAGADDFLSKPVETSEVLARVRMLLKVKVMDDRLRHAYTNINHLTTCGEQIVKSFDPLHFDFLKNVDIIVRQLMMGGAAEAERPGLVIVGVSDADGLRHYRYEANGGMVRREPLRLDILHCPVEKDNGPVTTFSNGNRPEISGNQPIIKAVESFGRPVDNIVSYHSRELGVYALNYGRDVTAHDAAALKALVVQTLFLRSLSGQVRDTENAFDYMVRALARAAEANDEDTGDHIIRVGEYCAVIAKAIGMPGSFSFLIRLQASMHDVGKIHIPPDILRKPGKLTSEQWGVMKQHPVIGGKILGDHVRLKLATEIALSHHERWDGSGYPHGLRGELIPLSGRIMSIADQYDALRNARVYKPVFDHETTYRIITEGDGRTMPHHFDPQVLKAFRETASQFEKIYEEMKG